MKNPPDDAELLRYSEEHLMHELSMLWETADALPKHRRGTTEYTALLESFATHARNLIEFLFFEISKDYVRARHFFDKPADWPHSMTAGWKSLYKRACHEVNHLTAHRVDGSPSGKEWQVNDIIAEFEPILREFATRAPTTKLHQDVRDFLQLKPEKQLLWLRDNVSHPNVAIVGPSVVSWSPSPSAVKKQ